MLNSLLLTLALSYADGLIWHIAKLSTQVPASRINGADSDKIVGMSGHYASTKTLMSQMIVTQPLNLQIWENDPRRTPPGASPTANRPVGFASLSFALENKTEQPIVIKIISIEVIPVKSKKALMSLPARDLTLHPLEIAPQRYQLSNRDGYGNVEQVEAVVIYQVNGQRYTLRSSPVKVRDN